jgi:hypothetical protein
MPDEAALATMAFTISAPALASHLVLLPAITNLMMTQDYAKKEIIGRCRYEMTAAQTYLMNIPNLIDS